MKNYEIMHDLHITYDDADKFFCICQISAGEVGSYVKESQNSIIPSVQCTSKQKRHIRWNFDPGIG